MIDSVPNHDIKIVMGDLNAKVGNDTMYDCIGPHCVGTINDNGTRFAMFCVTNNLVIGGTLFPHPEIHKKTWRSPDGQYANETDHIAISKHHRNYLQDVRSYRGADIGRSDLYLCR